MKVNNEHSNTFETEILKVSRRGPRYPENTEFGNFEFSLLFWNRVR